MSNFKVTIEKIGSVNEHKNADRLEMATLEGKDYDFVVMKDVYSVGEDVIYFPVDSILPDWIIDALDLTGKLSGKNKNRVRTMKLRGNISQGIVAFPKLLTDKNPDLFEKLFEIGQQEGIRDVTDLLEVVKYEAPVYLVKSGILKALPEFVSKYDIEGAQNYVDLVESLMDVPVYITEKLEGSHWSVTLFPTTDEMIVSQRNHRIEPDGVNEHVWHKLARVGDFKTKLQSVSDHFKYEENLTPKAVTIRGEAIGPGIQSNYYVLKEHDVKVFEIEINSTPVDANVFLMLCEKYDIPSVPKIFEQITLGEWLGGKSLKDMSNGQSLLNPSKKREGIVIKPTVEQRIDSIGRLFLKQRSPVYLLKNDT